MRLDYRILWIENDPHWQKTTEDMIRDSISDRGYILKTTPYQDYNEFVKKTDPYIYKSYDLILIDFKLDNDLTGDKFIEQVRKNNVYTDIIFYSQNSDELSKRFSELSLEGVYISNREDFEDKFLQVFKKTIKKLEELNAIRGLVMAETSRLDRIIEDILINHIDSEQALKNKAIQILEDGAKDLFIDKTKKINERGNLKAKDAESKKLVKRILDSYKRARLLKKLIEIKKVESEFNFESYKTDIIDKRNELAHVHSQVKEDNSGVITKEVLVVEKNDNNLEEEYTTEKVSEIRMNILKYDKILEDLKRKLK